MVARRGCGVAFSSGLGLERTSMEGSEARVSTARTDGVECTTGRAIDTGYCSGMPFSASSMAIEDIMIRKTLQKGGRYGMVIYHWSYKSVSRPCPEGKCCVQAR